MEEERILEEENLWKKWICDLFVEIPTRNIQKNEENEFEQGTPYIWWGAMELSDGVIY